MITKMICFFITFNGSGLSGGLVLYLKILKQKNALIHYQIKEATILL